MNDDYSHKRYEDPELSKVAGHTHNFLNPGTTHETTAISPMYVFGKNSNLEPETQNDLARFYGAAYTDGIYHVAERWALEEGLGTIDLNVMNRDDIRASFAEWRDVDVYDQQLELGKPRNVQKQLWYPEWELNTFGLVTEYVLGNAEIGDTLTAMQENLDGLKNIYPTL